jgi:hypothetical protein
VAVADVETRARGDAALAAGGTELVGDGRPPWGGNVHAASMAKAVTRTIWIWRIPDRNLRRVPIATMVSPGHRRTPPTMVWTVAFSAEVLSAGMGGHAALVPPEVAASFPTRRPAVVATVNGTEYRSRLMVYGGKTYLGLRKNLLRQIGAAAGDTVQIELAEDHTERVVSEPPELLEALAANPAARAAYDALAYSHRLEYARWISEGKRAETRAARTAKTIRRLLGS